MLFYVTSTNEDTFRRPLLVRADRMVSVKDIVCGTYEGFDNPDTVRVQPVADIGHGDDMVMWFDVAAFV